MKSREEFAGKLQKLVQLAKEKDSRISVSEVDAFFQEDELTKEQVTLVYEYLLTQKIVVTGYVKLQEEESVALTEEERRYLCDYESELAKMPAESEEEKELQSYFRDIIRIAKELNREDIFIGDLIQEGNLSLLLATKEIGKGADARERVLTWIRQAMQAFIGEQEEGRHRDQKMVEKVADLDEAITELTNELGRKITIDELAMHMGLTEEEIDDIMKLTGEERETSNEEDCGHEHHHGCDHEHHHKED